MNDLETALRDAFSARAAAVTQDPAAYGAVLDRRSRRVSYRLRAGLAVAGVAVAATSVVVAVALVTRGAPPRPVPPATQPPAPPPRIVVAVTSGAAFFLESDRPDDGGGGARPADGTVTAVTAVGDGTYYSASSPARGCTTSLTALRYEPDSHTITSKEPKGAYTVPGRVTDLAVSRDGTRLAYAAESGPGCAVAELRVRDLTTGRERVWTGGADPGSELFLQSLSWSPDARHLAYTAGLCCGGTLGFRVLDTTAPGADYLAPPSLGESVGARDQAVECSLAAPAYRGLTADLTAARTCVDQAGARQDTSTVVVVDPVTGAVLHELFTVPGGGLVSRVAFDPSGDHAFVERGGGTTSVSIIRWTTGEPARVLDLGTPRARGLAW
ncbi:MAG: hypothetical protein QOE45_2638 [Frankiaceae bacterium]|jgi:hypothetical protein|nr:hypothetical protein [Frankiaceae bacterium]